MKNWECTNFFFYWELSKEYCSIHIMIGFSTSRKIYKVVAETIQERLQQPKYDSTHFVRSMAQLVRRTYPVIRGRMEKIHLFSSPNRSVKSSMRTGSTHFSSAGFVDHVSLIFQPVAIAYTRIPHARSLEGPEQERKTLETSTRSPTFAPVTDDI